MSYISGYNCWHLSREGDKNHRISGLTCKFQRFIDHDVIAILLNGLGKFLGDIEHSHGDYAGLNQVVGELHRTHCGGSSEKCKRIALERERETRLQIAQEGCGRRGREYGRIGR